MKVLAIETATMLGGVAILSEEDGLIGELRVNVRIAHAERLMSAIQWLLNASQLSIKDISAFAVSIGPGSFTGLRIGLSTAKGFSYSTGKPLLPVLTLDAFARTLPFCTYLICPMLDARKDEVYTALYKWEDGLCKKIISEMAITPKEFLKEIKGETVFIGDGALIYKKLIMDTLKDNAVFAPPGKMLPSAGGAAEIAIEMLKNDINIDPLSLTPFYIRKSEAEI